MDPENLHQKSFLFTARHFYFCLADSVYRRLSLILSSICVILLFFVATNRFGLKTYFIFFNLRFNILWQTSLAKK
ncbi:MAG: DUF3623 family protein [Lachnospiraceae bacterium]|nr:DUF3623 family protein [Lachnospiraceae bacterium]